MADCETARLVYVNADHVDEDVGDKIRVDTDWFDVVGVDFEASMYIARPSLAPALAGEEGI